VVGKVHHLIGWKQGAEETAEHFRRMEQQGHLRGRRMS
jgi:hypothetical protein